MAGIKIDPEMLDIYMELLNKLMAGSETDGGNARLEVSGAGKTEDGLVRYNEEVNKLGDDLRELYGNVGEILGRIRDGTLFKNADKVSVVARSTDGAGVLAKHADEAAAWQHGGKVFRYSDETAEAVASGEKLLKESGTIYESFADMMSPEDAKRYLDFLENGSREGLTGAELAGVEKADALLVSRKVEYEDVWDLRNAGDVLETRAVAPGTDQRPYSVFEVVEPINVKLGSIASWFDEPGGGIQYLLPDTVDELLDAGILRRIQ